MKKGNVSLLAIIDESLLITTKISISIHDHVPLSTFRINDSCYNMMPGNGGVMIVATNK